MTRHDNDGSRHSHSLFAIILFAFSVVATFVVLKLKILDEPNQRSSHDRPTPSTGGMAIFATCACGFTVVWFVGDEAEAFKTRSDRLRSSCLRN